MAHPPTDFARLYEQLAQQFTIVETEFPIGDVSYRLLHPRSADELISEEEFAQDERLPYWADVWPAAIALARYLANESPRGRSLLELGCGLGLASLVASAQGFRVVAADYYPPALEFVRLNAWRHGLPVPEVRHLDWRQLPDDLGRYDLVVAADVLYERDYPRLIAAAMRRLVAPSGRAVMADPQRQAAATFLDECQVQGLRLVREIGIELPRGDQRQTIDVFELELAR